RRTYYEIEGDDMTIQILADSACDLTEAYYKKFSIEMVPLTVHLNNQEYEDGIGISPKKVYDAMREGDKIQISQVSPQVYKSLFTSYAKENKPLVYLAFSSELSGTYQTAKMIEQEIKETYPDAPIHVIDTKCASIGYGLVVLYAAKLARNGGGLEDIINQATYHADHMEHIFTVDDLEYLYRVGRVSKTADFVGSMPKIKPILHGGSGKVRTLEKIRGSKKVSSRLITSMEERGTDLESQTIGISHGDDLETDEKLARM